MEKPIDESAMMPDDHADSLRYSLQPIMRQKEMVNHPQHYNTGKFEVIDVIEDWNLNFNLGNTVKYIARAEHKGKLLEDLKKAAWYLEREIKKHERK